MKKIFHAAIIACAALSTNSFAGQSYACEVMLERGSQMFCQKAPENLASTPAGKQEVDIAVAKSEGSYACNTMLKRGSQMFCQNGSENPASTPAGQLEVDIAVAKSEGSFACNTMLKRGSEMFCSRDSSLPGPKVVTESAE